MIYNIFGIWELYLYNAEVDLYFKYCCLLILKLYAYIRSKIQITINFIKVKDFYNHLLL